MELYITVTEDQGEVYKHFSRLKINIGGRELECDILRLEGERLYLGVDEKDEEYLKSYYGGKKNEGIRESKTD